LSNRVVAALSAVRKSDTGESPCRFNILELLANEQTKETPMIRATLMRNRAESPAAVGFL
jgi:hypothetical protein